MNNTVKRQLITPERPVSRTVRKYLGLQGDGWKMRLVPNYGVLVCFRGDNFKTCMLEEVEDAL